MFRGIGDGKHSSFWICTAPVLFSIYLHVHGQGFEMRERSPDTLIKRTVQIKGVPGAHLVFIFFNRPLAEVPYSSRSIEESGVP